MSGGTEENHKYLSQETLYPKIRNGHLVNKIRTITARTKIFGLNEVQGMRDYLKLDIQTDCGGRPVSQYA
jgi:hypothetical protein